MQPSPHDALFKAIFSDPETAAAELRSALPAAVADRIDFSTLRVEAGSFVDEELRFRHCDLLFSARVAGRDALVYVLFEHQSSSDPLMALRMLRYVVRIWDVVLEREPGRTSLPLVVPVVLHHGERPWSGATQIADLVDLAEDGRVSLSPFVPRFGFAVDDLAVLSDAALLVRPLPAAAKLALAALRDVRDATDLVAWIRGWPRSCNRSWPSAAARGRSPPSSGTFFSSTTVLAWRTSWPKRNVSHWEQENRS
jgi:hypothetical protein